MGEEALEKPFKVYFSPLANLSTSCIQYPQVTARSFELKPSVLNCLLSFYGLDNEEALNDFYAMWKTFSNMRTLLLIILGLDCFYSH